MLYRIYNPEIFQGNLKRKHYFEGWYFKHVTSDCTRIVSVIPGVSTARNDPHAFVQIVDSGTGESDYIKYSLGEFTWKRRFFSIGIGSNVFTDKYLILDLKGDNIQIKGKIVYQNAIRYPRNIFSPGIMGWYSFIPFMECKHGIVSVTHDTSGKLSIGGDNVDFTGGKGYIEKDWGSSFPEAWIWIQSNNFNEHNDSFSFSIAKIPWLGSYFVGFITFFYHRGQFYLFSTYNGSAISEMTKNEDSILIKIRNKNYAIGIRVLSNSFAELRAPVLGDMSRSIKESTDSEVQLELFDKYGTVVYAGTGKCAGLEIIERIFDLI
jgi:tocopherol cyclase